MTPTMRVLAGIGAVAGVATVLQHPSWKNRYLPPGADTKLSTINKIRKMNIPLLINRGSYRMDIPVSDSQLIFREGKAFWKKDGKPLACDSFAPFVILESGEVLAAPDAFVNDDFVNHPGLSNGKPVLFAGNYHAYNGIIDYLDLRSGHFRPSPKDLEKAVEILAIHGVNKRKIDLDFSLGSPILRQINEAGGSMDGDSNASQDNG